MNCHQTTSHHAKDAQANAIRHYGKFMAVAANWQAPKGIVALTTANLIGEGDTNNDYGRFNVGLSVGEGEDIVRANRARLRHILPNTQLMFLNQTHSNRVCLARHYNPNITSTFAADASYSNSPEFACVVLTADCLPIVICDQTGREIAAIHAGWSGLYQGIIANTLAQFDAPPEQLQAWLAPAICPQHYEVDTLFYERFMARNSKYHGAFTANRLGHYLCDLYQLARIDLQQCGLLTNQISQTEAENCSFANPAFYSYRRQLREQRPNTGRMATVIARISVGNQPCFT